MKNMTLLVVVGAVLGGMTLIGYLNEPIEAVNVKPETVLKKYRTNKWN